MDIKCLHPVVLINPEARKKALDFDRVYIRDCCHHVYGRHRPVNLHRFRDVSSYRAGMADLHAEP